MRELGKVGILGLGGAFSRVDQVGYLKAIEERGIVPFCMTAVSVATFNFAGYLQYGSRGLELIWSGLSGDGGKQKEMRSIEDRGPKYIFDIFNPKTLANIVLLKPHILTNVGVQDLSRRFDPLKLIDSPVKLNIVVFNHETRGTEMFSNRDELIRSNPDILKQAILASVSPRGVFPPVYIQKNPKGPAVEYSDAITFGVRSLFDDGCDTVFVFRSRSSTHKVAKNQSWLSSMLGLHSQASNILLDEVLSFYKGKVIEFSLEEGVSTLTYTNFKKGDLSKTIDLAYKRALEILDDLNV